MTAPKPGSHEEHWYREGMRDEARARKEGLSRDAWDAMETFGVMARLHPEAKPAELLRSVASIIDGGPDLKLDEPIPFSVAASTAYEHGHPAHLCTRECPDRVKIQIVIREGTSAHLIMAPLEMMPLAPGSYEAELVVDE